MFWVRTIWASRTWLAPLVENNCSSVRCNVASCLPRTCSPSGAENRAISRLQARRLNDLPEACPPLISIITCPSRAPVSSRGEVERIVVGPLEGVDRGGGRRLLVDRPDDDRVASDFTTRTVWPTSMGMLSLTASTVWPSMVMTPLKSMWLFARPVRPIRPLSRSFSGSSGRTVLALGGL